MTPFGLCITGLILALVVITGVGVFWPVSDGQPPLCCALEPPESPKSCAVPGGREPPGRLSVEEAEAMAARHDNCTVLCPDRARAHSRLAAAAYIAANLEPGNEHDGA